MARSITRTTALFTSPFFIAISAAPVMAQGPGNYGQFWSPHMMGWGGGWVGMLFQIAFWLLLIALATSGIRWLFAASGKSQESKSSADNALEILRKRYAKGEIDKRQFQEMKADLNS
jgi:putative membrane protein